MDINPETRDRIIAAANQLYEQGGRADFPTVDAVRRSAKADMNTTSAVMKEWRRMQTATATTVAVAVPERVQQAQQAALASLWNEAQEMASEALKAAQQSWEGEREEADALRSELSQAFETQAAELAAALARVSELEAMLSDSRESLDAVKAALAEVQEKAHTAEARAVEIERRASELRAELDRAHADADILRSMSKEQQQQMKSLTAELDTTRGELVSLRAQAVVDKEERERAVQRQASAEATRDQALQDAALAREETARLSGRLDALTEQNAALLASVKKEGARPSAARKAVRRKST